MLLAVPSTIAMAPTRSIAFKSFNLDSAISRTFALEMVPTLARLGVAYPVTTDIARFIKSTVGGVLMMKLKERSSKMVISAGITSPAWDAVRSLYSLQKAMMFTPCWPRAGPTGGAGVALPALICSLTIALTFFAMRSLLTLTNRRRPQSSSPVCECKETSHGEEGQGDR